MCQSDSIITFMVIIKKGEYKVTDIQGVKNTFLYNSYWNERVILYNYYQKANHYIWDPLISKQIFQSDSIITFMVIIKKGEYPVTDIQGLKDKYYNETVII